MQNPLAADQGETVPGKCEVGEMYLNGRRGNIQEANDGRWPLALECAGGTVGSLQGFNQIVDT